MKAVRVESSCPGCRAEGQMLLLTTNINIPYFGEALESTLRCEACGFRHADFMILQQKDPLRLTFHANDEQALRVRVIRSNSGTVRIPELGFVAEPTPLSESYVSNVEGVLDRAKDVLLTAVEFHGEDSDKRALLDERLKTWEKLATGAHPFTLIIDDPFGNSAIVSEDVERRPLTEEEIAQLETGMTIIDASEIERAAEEGEDLLPPG